MSGIDITDDDSAVTLPSACGGTVFALAVNPDNFETNNQTGTDCGTLIAHPYSFSGPTALGPGPQTITLARAGTIFLNDNFTDPGGTNLSAHAPDIGSTWVQDVLTQNYILNGAGQLDMPGTGPTRYHNLATPATPDQFVQCLYLADAGWSDVTTFGLRYDAAANTGYLVTLTPPNVWQLIKRIAAVDTILAAGTFTMPTLLDPFENFTLSANGTTIKFNQAGVDVATVTDATISAAGTVMLEGNRSVGQPVTNNGLTAEWN